ncbi:myo-inositol-1-phosphate synthase [Aspergillus tubingensis]|uniref:inositol-3-phosphate synthase n=4 Tax=Aspergillus subgen. Circumdati TaxID=2720871 RepID=A0A100IUK5_ASPNG|nr:inositol-3-phosphate synthase [Aspergillus costaricaensis CBS 115574]XP_025558319.1 inositol-3-phosphate synthase [Aspergillus vadensis CBS 113365]XP_035361832.1 myo-inositol-1-phosphate synthase [Aspergillus tubingensis]GAQ47609.1 inositol-3-phosphate synthase [Aspergillus niger]PYH64525.1 inositol-3-phosphate synthase [Aspergillus vadensis CBS 113365]RAK88075.1 inositol-3-phosphate synthase [Aspergillus costaricaensis CBS 115574]GFN21028.1 myo-inositol-1-phosphate synthase [Aspergillus t
MAPHASSDVAANGAVNGSARANAPLFTVNSPNVVYTDNEIRSQYAYHTTDITRTADNKLVATPKATNYHFKVDRKVGKVGVMMVGWGGNNGSTVTAGLLANRRGLEWETREGMRASNYYGSVVMGSTIKLGTDAKTGEEINIPFHDMLPMVHPNDLAIGGWDISSMNLADSMDRAQVLEPTLKQQVRKEMAEMKPLPSIYYPDFIAANQEDRADNVLEGSKACWAHVEKIQQDIRDFKAQNGLDKVIVMWTANTERYADILPGVNDTADNLLNAIKTSHLEVSPSTVFAVACILDKVPFINGSPQNTFVPGAIQLAEQHKAFIGGDDFKSGQTKMKSALVDFLINAGIKLTSIASYNHLGNNDGKNLSSQKQFRSKEISKSNVVDDMVAANQILYAKDEHPDHTVVIKYMPAVGDNKRALDEYYAEIFMGGHQTISLFNICEDSLLASPLIIDLVLIAEMMTRISWKADEAAEYKGFHSVLSVLSYMLKAPLTPPGTPVVNSLTKQRSALTNIFRACVGLQPESEMTLEHKLF